MSAFNPCNNFLNKSYLFAVLIILFISITGCSKKNISPQIEERNGLLFILGEEDLFSGKIIDTVASKIISYNVVEGKKNGEFKILTIDGKIEIVGNIKNNLNEGLWTYYYPNGQIESTGNFSNNHTEGKWVWYFETGNLKEIGHYKVGKKDGDWIIFDEKGNIERKLFFNDDRIVFDHQFDKKVFS